VVVAETYLQHADPDGDMDVETGLAEVANLINKIKTANDLEFDIFFEGHTVQKEYQLSGMHAEIKSLIENFPSVEEFNSFMLTCSDDTFCEVLLGNIRNALVSFQCWIRKIEVSKISAVTKRINLLKSNYVVNQNEIFDLEQFLGQCKDEALGEKIKNLKIFEHLHN
jgi:hypothetical protein